MCACVREHVCAPKEARGVRCPWKRSYKPPAAWVLESELGSSARSVFTLNTDSSLQPQCPAF